MLPSSDVFKAAHRKLHKLFTGKHSHQYDTLIE